MSALKELTIKGFKSIGKLEKFSLSSLNILIGGNGAGKSNFIDFFRLIRAMMELPIPKLPQTNLQTYIADGGGSDDFLFLGSGVTEKIEVEMAFGVNKYRFSLVPTVDESFLIQNEARYYTGGSSGWRSLGGGTTTPAILQDKMRLGAMGSKNVSHYIYESIASWKIYHFHDTGKLSPMRRSESVDDIGYLRFDGANIAPYLFYLKNEHHNCYQQIIESIRLVTPFFDDFIFRLTSQEKLRLNWVQKGSDYPLKPHHFSDGTLRFIGLVTALLQPTPPSTLILDEPELGLHPYAIEILAELLKAASKRMQVIVSTQSPALVDCFSPENVVVVNREQNQSTFQRLNESNLHLWLEEYSLGELWQKQVITAGPSHE